MSKFHLGLIAPVLAAIAVGGYLVWPHQIIPRARTLTFSSNILAQAAMRLNAHQREADAIFGIVQRNPDICGAERGISLRQKCPKATTEVDARDYDSIIALMEAIPAYQVSVVGRFQSDPSIVWINIWMLHPPWPRPGVYVAFNPPETANCEPARAKLWFVCLAPIVTP